MSEPERKCRICGTAASDDEYHCSRCGEPLAKKPAKSSRSVPKPKPEQPSEDIAAGIPIPFSLTESAKWWMLFCATGAGACTVVAFLLREEAFLFVAFGCAALVFIPFLLVVFEHLFAAAVASRKHLAYAFLGLVGLAVIVFLAWGISKSHMSFNFNAVSELLRNQNFVRLAMTVVIAGSVLVGVYPLAKSLSRHIASAGDLATIKAHAEHELGLKATDGEVTARLKTIDMQKEIELRKLDIEEQGIQLENNQLTYHETKLLTDQRAQQAKPAREPQVLKNRVAFCRECGKKAYFSGVNASPDLCDDHNGEFARRYARCSACNEAVPIEQFAPGSRICPLCSMSAEG